jgi:hypothetical protein
MTTDTPPGQTVHMPAITDIHGGLLGVDTAEWQQSLGPHEVGPGLYTWEMDRASTILLGYADVGASAVIRSPCPSASRIYLHCRGCPVLTGLTGSNSCAGTN